MSIAAAKRRRKQHAKSNRHLARLGRPGMPKKMTAEQSAIRLARVVANAQKVARKKKAG